MENVYKKIDNIQFAILSPKEIKKMSSVKIVTPELYDKEGYPVDGGLMDVRLGVIDPGLKCKVCNEKLKKCMGHFGYIELARPIIHIKFANNILSTIRSICRECNRVLLDEKKMQEYLEMIDHAKQKGMLGRRRRISKEILLITRNVKKCPHCNGKQYPIKLEKPLTFLENDKKLSPIDIRTRFEKVSDNDVLLLGFEPEFARPEWFIMTIMPIPPVTIRPSITLETGERSEDDLTHKMGDIVRINQRLFENINAGAPEVIIEDLWDLLQYHVTTYFDNTITQIPPARHRSGQALKTLNERIKSKEGRFRYNLAGKRINYAARTVISPDPEIEINEVGIPKEVAKDLTIPEMVTEWNLKRLKQFVENGPEKYPGSNYVLRPDGKKKKISDETREQLLEELQPGYIVERHIMDGDVALFNRQPSLHRMSLMCHKIKVIPGKSFRLNPATCLAPDTLVQLSSGIQRPIDELKNCWKESELSTLDRKNKRLFSTELKKFWALKPEEYGAKCYEIITNETGRKVIATGDHPFYTHNCVKKAEKLNVGDKLLVRPIDTPIYKETDKIILTEEDIKRIAPKQTYLKHSLKILAELKLLPLNLIDQRTMILSRLLGHLYGDGTFILKKDVARLIFRGSENDLITIQNDIKSLGFNPEKIYIKTSNGIISTIKGKKLHVIGSQHCFEVRNKPLALLFGVLGAPNGDKVMLDNGVPKWIKSSPRHIKREFIASYFGSELTTPAIRVGLKSVFRSAVFKISKIKGKKHAGYRFINELKTLLDEFGIKIGHIAEETGNIRKSGDLTHSLAAIICDEKSMLNLFGKIGYIYDNKKDNIARLAYQYLSLKRKEIGKRKNMHKQFFELRKKGYKFKDIANKFNVSVGSLENWAYRNKNVSVPANFISFNDWIQENCAGQGLVYETIVSIKEKYCPFVYDITTISDTHNFFANGFLTKNCFPYNADFDGDEMNLHIPQTEEARAEAEILMQVQTQIISPKHGMNVIGCVEDSVSGNYILSRDIVLSKEDAISLLISIGVENEDMKKFKQKVEGKKLYSTIFPKDFNFIGKTKDGNEVIIRNGDLISGFLDGTLIGEESGSLIRELHKKYDDEKTVYIISKLFKLGTAVLLLKGFTTGISDTDLPEDLIEKIKEVLRNTDKEVIELIEKYKLKKLELLPGRTLEESLELKILHILNNVRNKIGEIIAKSASGANPTIIMARSGAKGNILNLAMMAACVGQQALRGRRIEKGYNGRTLSLFSTGALSAKAKGFIGRGYKEGLDPVEFFFGAMTGRDALMDTALRTPKSGYLYRRLSNALQDMKVEYDYTVRDANNKIVQFRYGEDGMDVSKSEGGTINVLNIIKEVVKND